MARSAQGGFSLIEVLVAFAILAMAVAVILSLFASGLRNTAVANDYSVALALAESKMGALQGIDAAHLTPELHEGVFDGRYVWQSAVRPQETDNNVMAGVRLYVLAVQVHWREAGSARDVELMSMRLGRSP